MPPNFEPLLVKHAVARRAIGVGQSYYWRLVRKGRIQTVGKLKAGRAVWSSVRSYVDELINEKEKEAAEAGKAKKAEADAGKTA